MTRKGKTLPPSTPPPLPMADLSKEGSDLTCATGFTRHEE